MEYAVQVKNLCKKYPAFSLDNVSFRLPKGYIMGMIGPNGAGKSTTLSLLLNLAHKNSGEAEVLGCRQEKFTRRQKEDIGVVLDECSFPGVMKIGQIDKFVRKIYKNWDSAKFFDLCQKFALPKETPVEKLSKGMKMKLSIAAALSHNPKLLILDEAPAVWTP